MRIYNNLLACFIIVHVIWGELMNQTSTLLGYAIHNQVTNLQIITP